MNRGSGHQVRDVVSKSEKPDSPAEVVRFGARRHALAISLVLGWHPPGHVADHVERQVVPSGHEHAHRVEQQIQHNKDLGGKVVISWRINSEGLVQMPKVRSTTMRNGSVEDCIVRQISGLKFPQPRGGQAAKVNFPFLFAPR